MRILPLQKLLSLIVMLCATVVVFAQPANDDCSSPTLLVVAADAASCVTVGGDTRGTNSADSLAILGPVVCSGSWFRDDVWYSFETGATPPTNGVTIEVRLDPTSGTELIEQGLAIYEDCDAATEPLDCFSDEPGLRTILFPPNCIAPNSTYLIRVWSAPEPRLNEGTFSICAYETPVDTTGGEPMPTARVIYEETFDKGFNGWTPVSESQVTDLNTGELFDCNWVWSNTGCVTRFDGTTNCQTITETACTEVGVVGIEAGFLNTGLTGIATNAGNNGAPPYENIRALIVSPPIDLSKEQCVNLTWVESAQYLNGGTFGLGAFVQYSLDGGETWLNPSPMALNTADVTTNYGAAYEIFDTSNALERSIPLLGAQGNSDVLIRFGFDGDFFFWIVDDIRIVAGTAFDGAAQENFFATSHINPMSIHQIDSYDFLIDIANLACEDLVNVNVNVTGVNSAGAEVHNVDLAYGDIQSDSLAQNVPFLQPFTPTTTPDNYDFTYTLSSDVDNDLSNNVRTFSANVVDETVFRKEDGAPTASISPNLAAFFDPLVEQPFVWEIGNMFFATNATDASGEQFRFNEISFQLNNADSLIDDNLLVWLYKVEDNDFDGIVDKADNSELTPLGLSFYTVTGLETGMITVDLLPFSGGDNFTDLNLEANTHYLASIETTTAVIRDVSMQISSNTNTDYSAAIFNSQTNANGDLNNIRYGHAFAITIEGNTFFRLTSTGDISTTNFGEDLVPVVRLGYEVESLLAGVATVEVNNALAIAISPNPASSDITVNLSIEQATDMEISIVDLAGRVISVKSFEEVTELRENFNISNLTNGVYMLHINTKDGVQTEKFVVSK